MVVGEQAAFDLQRLSKSGWAAAYFPCALEVARHVVVARSGIGMVFTQQTASDLQRLLVQRLGRRGLPLGVRLAATLSKPRRYRGARR